MPKRVQIKRIKNWRMPPNTLSVSRPNKWCNPFKLNIGHYYHWNKEVKTRKDAVEAFEGFLDKDQKKMIKQELKGKNLACLCPLNQPCHADVLLEIANEEDNGEV